jgi:hypothetical protein
MGYLIDAHCPKCGYSNPGLRFGFGMMRLEPPEFPAPCLNIKSRRITTKNLCTQHPEHFRFYTDPAMYRQPDNDHFIEFTDKRLSASGNYCPACQEYAMGFEVVAMVD